jgi:Mrp family chromosome partitioning ATPase
MTKKDAEEKTMADCDNCPSKGSCDSKETCTIKNNPYSVVKHVIGVMSGKGGVGKSTVSVLLAKALKGLGHSVGILDADITGPSIPRLLGIKNAQMMQNELGIIPAEADGIKVMSLNLLLSDERQPVIWRGPIISGTVKQFWEEVFWGELDYLIIDMPPGTGDVALTVMQSIPLSGMVMVTVPQDMVSMIVAKAVNMVKQMKIPLLGAVQNMSHLVCPHCGEVIRMYGEVHEDFYNSLDVTLLGELPMQPEIAALTEAGMAEPVAEIAETMTSVAKQVAKAVEKA